MQINCYFADEQQREIDAQRELVSKQVEDTTKLHVGSFIQKAHQRDIEKKAEWLNTTTPASKGKGKLD